VPLVQAYRPATWFTRVGAQKKLSQLHNKGLPSFKDWRFITLTLDPKKFSTAQSAYEYVKPRLRFFIRKLKRYLDADVSFVWKLEFQANGWAHWHLLVDYKKKILHDRLLDLWGFGFVEIQRVKSHSMSYVFKYLSKGLDSGQLPKWFLQYKRPRVFQTSGIFPPSNKVSKSVGNPNLAPACQPAPGRANLETLGQRLKRWNRTMLIIQDRRYVRSALMISNWWECLTSFLKQKPESLSFVDQHTFHVPWKMFLKSTQDI